MSGRKLLITGAAGFTGRHAVRHFAASGAEVTAVLRHEAASGTEPLYPTTFSEGVKTYICDLSDRRAVARMISDTTPDDVLHLAGKNSVPESWRDPLLYMETNVMATLYLLEALRSLPSSRILVAGSRLKFRPGSASGPPHPYSLSKTLEELVSLAWGTLFKQPVLLAEPCNLIGPGPSTGICSLLAQHIVRSEEGAMPAPFRLSSRFVLRDFLDVRDAVRAYDLILEAGETGKVYRIDSGMPRQLGEIAEQLLRQTSAPVQMDWGTDSAEVPEQQPEGNSGVLATPEDNVNTLGWKPEIGLEQSLGDIVDYYRVRREGSWL